MAGTIDDEVIDYEACVLPYSHLASYAQVEKVEVVALADVIEEKAKNLSQRWSVPRYYLDYREMVVSEKPHIVSVTTHATDRAEAILFCAENGVRAIYAEKALCCSLEEADSIVESCEKHQVKFNIGTSRRYHPGYRKMREIAHSGELGDVTSAFSFSVGALLHTHSHTIDLLMFLLGDPEPEAVAGELMQTELDTSTNRLDKDPTVRWAVIKFKDCKIGMMNYAPGRYEYELSCSGGVLRALNNNIDWELRKPGRKQQNGRRVLLDPAPFPAFERKSPTLTSIEELVEALDTDGETSGNVRIARWQMEISVALVYSHFAGSALVSLPCKDRSLYIPSR